MNNEKLQEEIEIELDFMKQTLSEVQHLLPRRNGVRLLEITEIFPFLLP